ncbi:PAN domain protein [Onchocerca flexuosa]|uniref:PAN domain protein n=1 Tax=Onchocerca flexuosa TaxID=387005 RepID=A0A238BZT1_9BILA|nr:PAN domain protein [Onchocerca flexuosa]
MQCLYVLSSISLIFFAFISINVAKTTKDSENVQEGSSFPIEALCENRLTAFTVSDNTWLVSSSSLVYEDVTEEVCLKMCSSNRDSNGRTILCASVVYDHAIFVCTVFRSKSYPEGDLKTEVAPGKRLFEKFCLKDAPTACADSRFLKIHQSVIIGYAKNVSLARSIDECIEQCLTEHFQCRSAMYFYMEGECITNTESAMTQPASFAREESDKVIYIQNGCPAVLVRQKQLENSAARATIITAESSLIAADENIENVKDEAETIRSTTIITEDNSNNNKGKKEGKKIPDTDDITAVNSSIEENALKQRNYLNDRIHNDKAESDSLFQEDSGKFASFEEATEASTIKEMSKILESNLKRVKTESDTVNFREHPKSLKQTKLQQMKRELTPEENEENHVGKNPSLEVRPSPHQVENQETERMNSAIVIQEGIKAQKPIKRLNIITLNKFKDKNHFSEWSDWSPCRRLGEKRIRRRKCYNLQRCIGALMEVKKCPKTIRKVEPDFKDGDGLQKANDSIPLMSVPPEKSNSNKIGLGTGISDDVSSQTQQPHSENESTEKTNEKIWSPWRGICQEFASGHPCKNHEIIGFESRDCLATDNAKCKGPFFRYCTISC